MDDDEKLCYLEQEILEAARLLSLKGKRAALAKEIRSLAMEHLRIELDSATEVRPVDGCRFAETGLLVRIERLYAWVEFPDGRTEKMAWWLLRDVHAGDPPLFAVFPQDGGR